jgi:hypothetical protein
MESTATPPPPPPPPGDPAYAPESKASAGRRVLAVLLAIVLAFAAAVIIAVMVDLGDRPRCDDTAAIQRLAQTQQGLVKCFDVTSTQRTVTLILGWVGGVLGGIAALLALAFAVTGTRGRLVLQASALAVVLCGLSILIGSI